MPKAGSVRSYIKRDDEYWKSGGIQDSRRKRQRSAMELPTASPVVDIESMSAGELRTELRSLGVTTRVKCAKKLRTMLASSGKD